MERTNIPLNRAKLNALRLFDEWLLLAAGDFAAKAYNAMTISYVREGIGRMGS